MDKIVKKVGANYFLFEDGLPRLKLNETGAFILKRRLEGLSEKEIAGELSAEYKVEYDDALNDVSDFLLVNKL